MKYEILDTINSPSDIRGLNLTQLRQLCGEIRSYMIDCCSRNPGHLGSSLGAVELIVGFHYVFNTPDDEIIFDVGHQAYAHKILTGRREAFQSLRSEGGISGFPRREESEYDVFGVGHSSTSISAALGLAEAAQRLGQNRKVAALIGDGALSGGLAFEGLNNAGSSSANLLVILNDNDQSIDSSRGAVNKHLLKVTMSRGYNRAKNRVWNSLGESRVRAFVQRWTRSFKSWLIKRSGGDIFEALGLRYFGPVDGNDITQVVSAFRNIRDIKGPRVLHCITKKGKGFAAAEDNPVVWHAPGKFDPATGERIKSVQTSDRYQDVFGKVLCELCEKDDKLVGITPAMASGCGMNLLAETHPDKFFDVGIEEEHAVTFSAGLAAGGLKPFCNLYSTFSQRAFDQIVHDVALQKLPVVFCFDRAGLVGEDGATHQGSFDIATYRCIPNTVISAPRNEIELKNLMYTALSYEGGPFIIRYPRGVGEGVDWKNAAYTSLVPGKAQELLGGSKLAVVATGPVVNRALEAAASFGNEVGVYNFTFVKPLDEEMLEKIASSYSAILTAEDGCLAGGLYGAVCEYMEAHHHHLTVDGVGIPDEFVRHAKQSDQRVKYGLDTESLKKRLENILHNSK